MDIPALLKVVADWDRKVRLLLPENGYWFAPFSPDTKEIDISFHEVGEHRDTLARRNLKSWMDKVGLPYHSPHKFRHGHIQYGLSQSKTIVDYKAVSMNVMHKSMDITDEIYSRLGEQEIKERIDNFGKIASDQADKQEDTFTLFQEFLEWRKSKIMRT